MIVDDREPRKLINELSKRIELEVRRLDMGDYLINNDFVVERKTREDFESSIIDKRIFKQIHQLKENYNRILIIVEGTTNKRLSKNILLGTYASLISSNVSLFFTRNMLSTVELLESLWKHEQKPKRLAPINQKRTLTISETSVAVIEQFPLIGPKMARTLLEHFGSIKSISNASYEDLMKIKGLGAKRARIIINLLEHIYDKEDDRFRKYDSDA